MLSRHRKSRLRLPLRKPYQSSPKNRLPQLKLKHLHLRPNPPLSTTPPQCQVLSIGGRLRKANKPAQSPNQETPSQIFGQQTTNQMQMPVCLPS